IKGNTIIVNPNEESAIETTAKGNKVKLDPLARNIRVLRSKNWDQDSTLNLDPVIPATII
ncbi:MAG TPA: hypothetical protein VFY68_18005, partial [Nitrososphaeraceae archaeon]|nr:hypothetical protein [Nitrososphaeraceae archaeon]